MTVSSDRIIHWLQQLVQIPSVNPAGHKELDVRMGEGQMAAFLAEQLEGFGGWVELEEVFPQRPNVYAFFSGRSDKLAVVDVHMDTVDVTQMIDPPFDGRVENGRMWGRGVVDTKATMGIMLALLERLHWRNEKPKYNLLIVGTVSEEYGGFGAKTFAKWARRKNVQIDQLLVAEPTLCGPIYAHKGVMGGTVYIHGRPAHSSTPEEGANAITAAAHVILAIDAEHKRLKAEPAKTALGHGVIAATVIEGGSGHNVIPDSCRVVVNRRLTAFESPEEEQARLTKLVEDASPLPVTVEFRSGLPALYQEPDSPWIQQMAAWGGREPAVAPYGTNALSYKGLAKETIVFGPGSIEQAHKAQEWVAISELEKAADVLGRWLL